MIWIKNAQYVPYMYFIMLNALKGDCLMATALTIRLFTINYFFWFQEWSLFGQLRQCVRFTDSQTVLCSVYWWSNNDPNIGQLAYNVLALVTFGFWGAKLAGIDETLVPTAYPFFQSEVSKLYHYINHGLLFLLLSLQHHTFRPTKIVNGTPEWRHFSSSSGNPVEIYNLRLPSSPILNLQRYNDGMIGETLLYILFYLMLVYIPWYFFTGDRIYDV
jgi:hypothetical protein